MRGFRQLSRFSTLRDQHKHKAQPTLRSYFLHLPGRLRFLLSVLLSDFICVEYVLETFEHGFDKMPYLWLIVGVGIVETAFGNYAAHCHCAVS